MGEGIAALARQINIDAQTGELLGEIKGAPMGPPPAKKGKPLTWAALGDLSVVGGKGGSGQVKQSDTKAPIKGKAVLLRSGKWLLDCRYDRKSNTIWRRQSNGPILAGTPDARLRKALTT